MDIVTIIKYNEMAAPVIVEAKNITTAGSIKNFLHSIENVINQVAEAEADLKTILPINGKNGGIKKIN